MKILVLAGGLSPERNVSLTSGGLISAALRRKGHKTLLLDVYEGLDIKGKNKNEIEDLFGDGETETVGVGELLPDLDALVKKNNGRKELIGEGVIELCRAADVTFLALHGAMGENGQLQATLDVNNIVYTGTGYIGSLLAMDKDISKKLFRSAGVMTPDWERVDTEAVPDVKTLIAKVGLPAVVKPCSCGSSVGVSIVRNEEELTRAIGDAARFERYILVESMIEGRELTSGVLDGRVLPPVEIIPKSGFYDYKNKYAAGATVEICPAPLDGTVSERLAEATLKGFEALRLEGYARLDFILGVDGELWCLEANTLPGMTPTSLLPQEAAAVGIAYDELCETLAMLALKNR